MEEATQARLDAHEAALAFLLRDDKMELPAIAAKLAPAARTEFDRLAKMAREQDSSWGGREAG